MRAFSRPNPEPEPESGDALAPSGLEGPERLLPFVLLLTATFPLIVALRHNINWDEFLFLSRIYKHQRGELTQVIQAGYVHAFGWLTSIGSQEIDQIITARGVYFFLLLLSGLCLYAIARLFASRAGAIAACIAFVCQHNVMVHGASFRADGMALFLYMLCLTVLLRKDTAVMAALGGALFGAGIFITVKFVLFALAVGPILLLGTKRESRFDLVRRLTLFGVGGAAGLGIPMFLHARSLGGSGTMTTTLAAAGEKTLYSAGFLPQPDAALQSLLLSPAIWLLIMAGLIYLLVTGIRDRSRRAILPVILCLPLLSVFFYRNSFPYFYATIIPPALVLVGVSYDLLKDSLRHRAMAMVVPLVILFSDGLPTVARHSGDTIEHQREIVEAIHAIFPEPVPYIDAVSMIGAYPKVGFFMSTWGMENYLANGRAVFRELVEINHPKFVLANRAFLEVFDHPPGQSSSALSLLPADREFLRSQFVHHWGPLYVPGVEAQLVPGHPVEWFAVVPGTYTVEADALVVIDSLPAEPGSTVRLEFGNHELVAASKPTKIILRWGDNIYRPSSPPPETPLFLGF